MLVLSGNMTFRRDSIVLSSRLVLSPLLLHHLCLLVILLRFYDEACQAYPDEPTSHPHGKGVAAPEDEEYREEDDDNDDDEDDDGDDEDFDIE